MQRARILTVFLGGALVLGGVTWRPAHAGKSGPVLTEVVATITALHASNGTATLQTKSGEVYKLPKAMSWKVGSQVECPHSTELSGRRGVSYVEGCSAPDFPFIHDT
jgi:hypothetical protein